MSLVVLTNAGDRRLARLLAWAESKSYINHCLGFIDIQHCSAGEREEIQYEFFRRGITYYDVDAPNIDAALAYCHSPERIKTDWALHLGTDELMGEWFDEDIDRLMAGPYDVYSLPRYNLVYNQFYRHENGEPKFLGIPTPTQVAYEQEERCFISSSPWYPDFAQRLFRPGYLEHRGAVHEGAIVKGRLSIARPHIFHFDFIDESLAQRQAKWEKYIKQGVVEESRKRGLEDDYYKRWCIPEDFEYEIKVCEEKVVRYA